MEEEIFEALYNIHTNPNNKDQCGQTHKSSYSEGAMEKLLTKDTFKYLVEGKSIYGKFSTYFNRGSIYQAITLSSKFYEKARSI